MKINWWKRKREREPAVPEAGEEERTSPVTKKTGLPEGAGREETSGLPEKPDMKGETEVKLEKINVDLTNKTLRIDYIQRLCEGIREAKRQCEEIKGEYGKVTSLLKDIQLIDQALPEDKETLLETASAIVELVKERDRRKGRRYKFTDAQRAAFENYEGHAPRDIAHMKEYEDYQIKIKHDLRQLDSEKKLLMEDKRDIIRRQSTLSLVTKVLGVILAMFGILMLTILFVYRTDIRVPFLATAVFAFVVLLIIVLEARKNRTDMVLTERKCNKAISLSNRVKIKYVNNTRSIDYLCLKYHVRNGTELEFVYDQYSRAVREWARQREDAFILNEKNELLVQELSKLGVKDCGIWPYQANALVEPKEMVEVRHGLNERRQKLRGQIDYNNGVMQDFIGELEKIRDKRPEYAEEIEEVLKYNS